MNDQHDANAAAAMATGQKLQAEGVALFNQHEYDAAKDLFEEARDAYAQAGRADLAAEMTANIGLIHREVGELDAALEAMQTAYAYFSEQNDALRAAQVCGNMGGLYDALEDKEQAQQAYHEALETFKALGEEDLYAETLSAMGNLRGREGIGQANIIAHRTQVELGETIRQGRSIGQDFAKRMGGWFRNRQADDDTSATPADSEKDTP